MRPDLRLVRRIFRVTGTPFILFGLSLTLCGAAWGLNVDQNPEPGIAMAVGGLTSIFVGIFFGTVMALGLACLHASRTKDLRVKHKRWGVIRKPLQEAKDLCIEALTAIHHKVRIHKVDGSRFGEVLIEAKKGLTMRTNGDVICCQILTIMPDCQVIQVASEPKWRAAMVDYGSNLENVETVVDLLEQCGARFAREPSGE